jgi:hypothetical protein
LPRVLSMIIIVFLSLFSFDVFGQGTGFLQTLGAFLIHNIPSIILIVVLIFSWRWSWIGGASYILIGILYIILYTGRSKSLFIDLTFFTTGILFLFDWFLKKEIIKAQEVCRGR